MKKITATLCLTVMLSMPVLAGDIPGDRQPPPPPPSASSTQATKTESTPSPDALTEIILTLIGILI